MQLHLETSSMSYIIEWGEIYLNCQCRAVILDVVCRYLYYKWFYEGSTTEIPEFKVDPEIVLEVLMTADFLEC